MCGRLYPSLRLRPRIPKETNRRELADGLPPRPLNAGVKRDFAFGRNDAVPRRPSTLDDGIFPFVQVLSMTRYAILLSAALAGFPGGDLALGGELAGSRVVNGCRDGGCAAKVCCPDLYIKKPLPCPACPKCRDTVAVYCCKPQPCVGRVQACGCPDTYCKKPLPYPCVSRLWEYYRCAPGACD